MRARDFRPAAITLRHCASRLEDKELQAKVKAAEVASHMAVINDPKASALSKGASMQQLAIEHPDIGKPYEARAAQLLALAERQAADAEKARRKREGAAIGMTPDDVLASAWGRPERVNRTITAAGVREQWVYPGYNYIYITNGVVTGIQTR